MKNVIKQSALFTVSGLVFLIIGGLAVYIYLGTRYVSEPWHVIDLGEEFRVARMAGVSDFNAYLKLEDRLFKALHEKVYTPSSGPGSDFDRYRTGSRSDPSGFPVNWNRTVELAVDNPRGGVLLMHGLTDSPYSIRSLAQKFQDQGFWVVGIRLPGHGTIPSELLDIQWEDWAAVARMGARRVMDRIGNDLPFYLMGYSTGAALAVEYALSAIDGEAIPKTDGLILLSPAIGLTPVAALAKFQVGLSRLPGLGKLSWESTSPEYDPYKYNSFPVNAGEQVYRLALNIQNRIKKMDRTDRLGLFPKVIAFQSIVDGTIQAGAVVDKFLNYLPREKNTLVVFDVNQQVLAQGLLTENAGETLKASMFEKGPLPFGVELVTNMTPAQRDMRLVQRKAGQAETTWKPIALSWPPGIYSLSHVALPFPPDDPVYGDFTAEGAGGPVRLGNIRLRGEKNVFAIPQQNLMRLRHNPFFSYMENRIFQFVKVSDNR